MESIYDQIPVFLLSYASIQGVVLVIILLFFKKGNRKANLTLAVLTGCIVALTTQFVAILLKWHEINTLVAFPLSTLRYAIGPLMLLFVKQLLKLKIKTTEVLHFVVFVAMSLWVVNMVAHEGLDNTALRISKVLTSTSVSLSGSTYIFMLINKLHPLIYGIVCLVILFRQKKIYQQQISSLPDNIPWLIKLCMFFIGCQLLSIAVVILFYFQNYYTLYLDILVVFCYSIIIHFIGLSAIIWFESIFPVNKPSSKSNFKKMGKEDVRLLQARISNYVESEKPFLNPSLKLNDLANSLGLSPHELSYAINNAFGMNFYDYINRYRVEELKSQISKEDHQHFTLLGNALEAGFNSKASFNRNFKKHTGMTPTAYMKSIKK